MAADKPVRAPTTTVDAATAIGHAVASQHVGPARFDLAARLWAFPLTLVVLAVRQVARVFAWVPGGGLAWHLRIVLGIVALVQGFQRGGDVALGITTASMVAASYIAPAADRARRTVVEREADQTVARRALLNRW
ncbi:hypothetical protein KV102_00315 [Mumia sp. zg.B53]|uniref:hypothetical protein n=1 Tax=Mumia sp. zg.B53 TaxID=2855449 RepID=UPI001C6DF138|nr:hypothetical protein [Mumia sp. zg.B53]MBW9213269.1 hypothetical protein [Mumia sp. zg.B53]